MRVTERTSLTRPTDSPDYVEFASLLRTRRARIRNFQCCICAGLIAVFTIALVVTISYSVSHINEASKVDTSNLTSPSVVQPTEPGIDVSTLKLSLGTSSDLYKSYSSTSSDSQAFAPSSGTNVGLVPKTQELSNEELKEALTAGQRAVEDRLSADTLALSSPLPSPSPEARHRWAVSTGANVGGLALAAIGEIAATRKIENARSLQGEPSAIGSFFDGGWTSNGVCREFMNANCTIGKYRTFDGSCNRPKQRGSALTPFRRILPADYADGIDSPRRARSGNELPSAREVSLKVHKPSPSSNPSFTVMLAVFGQFLDHDITATAISQGVNGSSISCCPPSIGHPECFPVTVGSGDPVYDVTGRTCMDFVRSAPAPQCKIGPREQLNQVTAFIDGSAIYGSDQRTAYGLREFSGGRLRMQITPDNRTLLPASLNPNDGCNRDEERTRGRYCFVAGDPRANENLHLTTMHLIWARQHNRIADELAKINPAWTDEKIYQEARRIVGAQLQHITYGEFVPIILGDQETNIRGLKPLPGGYRTWTESPDGSANDPTIANSFAAAAFRFAHTLLPGLMMMTSAQKGTSSYVELHRMLFNPYSLYANDGIQNSIMSATRNVIQRTSTHVTSQLTRHLFEDPMSNVSVPCGLDLVSLNIQRGRDHGLPGYTRWREYCNLGKPESFVDLVGHMDPEALDAISKLYESVDDVDLYTGALAEIPKTGSIVGPTFTCLIADQFVRLQKGDRYWYEIPGQPHSFTEEQLQELRKSSLAKLLCDCSDDVTQIQSKVMRSLGPDNPMISCEDLPTLSLEMWKEGRQEVPILKAAVPPYAIDWLNFKKTLSDTIQDVVIYINSSRTTIPPGSPDWVAFGNELNDTFSQIRNELNGLNMMKKPLEMVPKGDGSFILRGPPVTAMFTDWIQFKSDLIKNLNDTIGGFGAVPPVVADWVGFKAKIKNETFDLISQIIAAKMDLYNYTLKDKTTEMAAGNVGIQAIFDWKNFKDDIIDSLDDAIMNIATNMPGPGDPAWATFGTDIRDRFIALHDKIIAESSTVPTEMDVGTLDWMSIKSDILNTVSDTVKNIEAGMPPPGDPEAWLAYKDKIVKSFTGFNKFPGNNVTSLKNPYTSAKVPFERAPPSVPGKSKANPVTQQLLNLTDDWLDFRNEINATIAKTIADIQAKNLTTTIDPIGWIMFGNSFKTTFAALKNEIAGIKAEWANMFGVNKLVTTKSPTSDLKAPAKTDKIGKAEKTEKPEKTEKTKKTEKPEKTEKIEKTTPAVSGVVKAGPFVKPTIWPPTIIPAADWVTFKNEINDTVTSFLNAVNITNAGWANIGDMYAKSFDELKNEIVALRGLIAFKVTNSTPAADWIKFHSQLNTTVNDLVQGLKNQTRSNVAVIMRILFDAKDKFSALEPPIAPPSKETENWASYFVDMNNTIDDALKTITDTKRPMARVKADEPTSSSSSSLLSSSSIIQSLSLASCLSFANIFNLPNFTWKLKSRICVAC